MKLLAPAKINLFLQVTGRRGDGYHELRTLMCCVGIFDTLTVHVGTPRNEIRCDYPGVPADATNLALKAAVLFHEEWARETGSSPMRVSLHLDKTIPVGAGLGGGSSDAAAMLNGLNQYHGLPFERTRLHAMALSLGADVPFFIDRCPAVAMGIGERLMPFHGLPPFAVLLVYPGFVVSTAEVFKNLNLRLTKCEKKLRYLSFDSAKFSAVRHLCNDLETAVIPRYPVIEKIKKELLNQGAMGALMTGSGSTVFGLFATAEESHRAEKALARQAGWQVFSTQLLLNPLPIISG
jgi:4-diphosphocytidyl-2-C-methyl-D-erythritol kinase